MKTNLRRFVCLLAVIATLGSCKKPELIPIAEAYFFKAKFNGVEKSFSTKAFATKNSVNGFYTLAIVASFGNETTSIALWSKTGIFQEGSEFGIDADGCPANNSFDYTSNQLSNNQSSYWSSVYVHGSVPEKFRCKLTKVTSGYIRGTFSADVYSYNSPAPQKMIVSDGEFYVRLSQ